MIRNETERNIKWMFTLSLLFHLLFLFTLSYPNLFSKLYPPARISVPLSAIHVNIVDIPRESRAEAPVAEKPVIDQKLEVRDKKSEGKSKKQEMKDQKVVQKAKMTIPEPVVKEKSPPPTPIKEEGREEGMDTQRQQTLSSTETEGNGREARLAPAGPVVSGPVVDISDFKYDYYLGVIRNKIDSRWSQPVAYSQVKRALIEFTIHRNGEIGNIRVSESSGDHYFDQTALRAVSLSNPFPPLPRGYKENLLKVRYRFIFGGKG